MNGLRAWLIDQSRQAHEAADHPDGQPGDPGGYFDKGAAHMADAVLSWLGDHGRDARLAIKALPVERIEAEGPIGGYDDPGTHVEVIGRDAVLAILEGSDR